MANTVLGKTATMEIAAMYAADPTKALTHIDSTLNAAMKCKPELKSIWLTNFIRSMLAVPIDAFPEKYRNETFTIYMAPGRNAVIFMFNDYPVSITQTVGFRFMEWVNMHVMETATANFIFVLNNLALDGSGELFTSPEFLERILDNYISTRSMAFIVRASSIGELILDPHSGRTSKSKAIAEKNANIFPNQPWIITTAVKDAIAHLTLGDTKPLVLREP